MGKYLSQIPPSFDYKIEGKIQGECAQRMDVRDDDNRTLYDRFAYPVSKYICRYLPNTQDAEDLLVEVFLAAFNNKELLNFSAERQLAWLIRVARNKLVDRRRHMTLLSMVPIDLVQEIEDGMPSPEQQVQQQESYERLNQALKHLSPSQRELLSLRYISNMNYREIANILGKSEEAIRQMCSRTLRQLRGDLSTDRGREQQCITMICCLRSKTQSVRN